MMEEGHQVDKWEGYVDWLRKPALRGHHGGMLAGSFVLVVEVLENLSFLANASNLVTYMEKHMNFDPSEAANNVTNFMGTAFLLALLGGFLSDAFFSTYLIFLVSAAFEFLGLLILTAQAHFSFLRPPRCEAGTVPCHVARGAEAAMLFTGLYLVALGVGGIKGSLPAHGAEQFDETNPVGRKQRSSFFNYFVFCLSCGGLIAVTFVAWFEDNKGWEWGFGISTLAILISIPVFLAGSFSYMNKLPSGSPLTTIFMVLFSSMRNVFLPRHSANAVVSMNSSPSNSHKTNNRAAKEEEENFEQEVKIQSITAQQVEDVKVVLKMLPIFGCTIILNCCLAQLSTFSVQQAAKMDTKLGSLKVPPASLPVFPILFIMILAPLYDHIIIPFARKVTKSETGITHLQRIGIGLLLSILAMAVAALVETKRKKVAMNLQLLDSKKPLPITFFWIGFQYLFLGSADLFTLAGLMEFFFTEAPASMRSLATSLSWVSLAVGYYLSSVIVSIVNSVTGHSGDQRPWLSGKNLNYFRLERFYWLMCLLSALNFTLYLYLARRYKYQPIGALE